MDKEVLKAEVDRIRWFHRIDLGNGIVTPGLDQSAEKLATIGMPANLEGWSVLDIGAWDGFFSFEAEKRGAARVLAIDSVIWSGQNWGSKAGFDLARRALKSKVEGLMLDVYDVSEERTGRFDLVLFLGVLYHLKHPLYALEKVFDVTERLLILESHLDLLAVKRPAMAFYPSDELNHDGSNWWGPNLAALEAMLLTVGFSRVELHWRSGHEAEPHPDRISAARAVFHAWR